MRDELAATLHETTSASEWTDAFIEDLEEVTGVPSQYMNVHRAWLHGWFANAIETGRSAGLGKPVDRYAWLDRKYPNVGPGCD